jgi:hypothetical protein
MHGGTRTIAEGDFVPVEVLAHREVVKALGNAKEYGYVPEAAEGTEHAE